MNYHNETGEIFGRINADGNVDVLYKDDGSAVTRLNDAVYPIGSAFSTLHDHPEGIVISIADANNLGMDIEH